MSIVRWDPFVNLSSIQKGMSNFFDNNFFTKGEFSNIWSPSLDVQESNEAFLVEADLPGLKIEDINLEINKNNLVISGERKSEKEEKETNFYKKEISYGSFKRELTLPQSVDSDKISAKYTDGVLHINIPKSESTKPKQITIN